MNKIDFSIVTVCRNSLSTIGDTLKSVNIQTGVSVEHIFIDGNSVDGTFEFLLQEAAKNSVNVTVKSQNSSGIYTAMNEGLFLCSGKYIGFLNSDDYFIDDKVLLNIKRSFESQRVDIVYGNVDFIRADKPQRIVRYWRAGNYSSFTSGWHPPHPAFYMKRDSYKDIGYYRIDMKVSADFELMLRAFENFKLKSFYLDEHIVRMRLGGESTGSLKNIVIGNLNVLKAFKMNGIRVGVFYPLTRIAKKLLQKWL